MARNKARQRDRLWLLAQLGRLCLLHLLRRQGVVSTAGGFLRLLLAALVLPVVHGPLVGCTQHAARGASAQFALVRNSGRPSQGGGVETNARNPFLHRNPAPAASAYLNLRKTN